MAASADRVQALMDGFYTEWRKDENRGRDKWALLEDFSEAHQIAVVFGNFNYQVENGGLEQWIYNGYFHDDAEKFTEYLETGAPSDDRFQVILDRVNLLDQYAKETDCDREGTYHDEDGEVRSISELMDCDKFDTWYYDRCGNEDWWETVCGIMDKAQGRDLPPAHRNAPVPDKTGGGTLPLQAYIENARHPEFGGFTIPLPTTKEALAPWLAALELTGGNRQNIAVRELQGDMPELLKALRHGDHPLDELNYLAAKAGGLDGDHRELFLAALDTGEYDGDIGKIINLTENLDLFHLQPAFGPEQYGEFLLDQAETEHLDAIAHLETSGDPKNIALARHILRLEAHIDKAAYGRSAAEAEHGTFSEHGYLTEFGEFREAYRGPQDIPSEYRVFDSKDNVLLAENAGTYKAVKDVDLPTLLTQIHAVGGEYARDTEHSLRTLADGSTDYFVLLNQQMAHVVPAEMLYHRETLGNGIVLGLQPAPDIQTYFISVAGREDGRITGSMYGLALQSLQESLRAYSIDFSHIDAELRDGSKRIIPFAEWSAMDRMERGHVQSYAYHYDHADASRLRSHIAGLRMACGMHREPEPAAEFLSRLNASYMASAENPQPDMLRVTLSAAKDMLTHGDAPVYRLLPEGPKALSPLEAMQSRGGLWYQRYREFAIHKRDMGGLEAWAGREAKAMAIRHQPDRDASEKPKPRGPER